MGIIYKLTSPSGKIYIGQTKKTAEHRWDQHRNVANNDKCKDTHRAIYNAIRKYGWENFEKEIIMECENCQLDSWERLFIQSLIHLLLMDIIYRQEVQVARVFKRMKQRKNVVNRCVWKKINTYQCM